MPCYTILYCTILYYTIPYCLSSGFGAGTSQPGTPEALFGPHLRLGVYGWALVLDSMRSDLARGCIADSWGLVQVLCPEGSKSCYSIYMLDSGLLLKGKLPYSGAALKTAFNLNGPQNPL